uniref:Uncharacterized protein n=1 Tax=Panagrolaimus sp. PS1159 TaxID=55785 RepID=A0AC35G1R3_9BILA
MAFYGSAAAAYAPFAASDAAAFAQSAQYNGANNASRNLYMANADPDYFINPLDDNNAYYENQNNIPLACNPSLNQSCVWQGFVEADDADNDFSTVTAFPSESEANLLVKKYTFFHEFVVTDPNSEEPAEAEQQPQQLLLAIPSYALSEANQTNAALPQLNQLQPQLHRQPSAALCPTVMEANIPCLPEYLEGQVLLGEDHYHHHLTLDNSNSNIFFATNVETNESYIYEYFEQPNSNNSNDSQTAAPICFNLIDGFVDEVRGEMKAEASLPIEFKCTNVFYEVRKWEEEVEESINDHQLQLPSSSSISSSSSSSSPPIYHHYGPPMFLSESPQVYL